jgi:uncharacterized protein involved in copper resistance
MRMKRWIGILVALSLILAFSLPAYAQQKAKPAPMSKEAADKMMEECLKTMDTTMAKMKEMHEKMHKGEMQVDPGKMKKMRNSIFSISKDLDEIQMKGY